MKKNIQLIWFKKNLRIKDNEVFQKLDSDIDTIGFFLIEDEIVKQNDFSYFHLKFIIESLLNLEKNLQKLNIRLIVKKCSFENFIIQLEKNYNITKIVSTQETWNLVSYKRDLRVIDFLKKEEIKFLEVENNWIIRKLKNRDNWTNIWNQRMWKNIFLEKKFKKSYILENDIIETKKLLSKYKDLTKNLKNQIWWEDIAIKYLDSFLETRFNNYSYNIWKPYESTNSCSRLSPYITYWNISIKYIYQKSIKKILELKLENDYYSDKKIKQINFFLARIHWQSHFIQKLESQVDIEYKNLNSEFDYIRDKSNIKIINDFFSAKTWIPYIDAAIICLKNTWRINFRTRACIVSYICNTMMQPWQSIGKKLACLFTDYEPWIHYSQLQMQAWTTGINTIRIYNPIKQSKEKDLEWKFIKKWIPELRKIPNEYIHEPRLYHEKIKGYEEKIEIEELNKIAREKLWLTKTNIKKENKDKIIKKHASRKNIKKKNKNDWQLTIF